MEETLYHQLKFRTDSEELVGMCRESTNASTMAPEAYLDQQMSQPQCLAGVQDAFTSVLEPCTRPAPSKRFNERDSSLQAI